MQYDVCLVISYWKKHKRQALSLLIIFVMLFSYLFISMSMVRTELRRIYFDGFYRDTSQNGYPKTSYGGYDCILYDVKISDFPELHDTNYIDSYASVFTCGYAGTDNYNYTAGYYPDEDAFTFAGYPFSEGRLPKNADEVAVCEIALENMGIIVSVGEKITLSLYDEKRENLTTEDFTLCGILKDNGTNGHWDTYSNVNDSITKFYEPTVLFSPEVFKNSEVKESIMFNSNVSEHITNEEQENDYLTFLMNCFESSGNSSYNQGARDSNYFVRSNLISTENIYMTDKNSYYKSPKSYLYQITGLGAAILMAITLCCGLFAILPERLKSFRLLWQVGFPLWRIRRMLMIECIGFTAIGLLLGLGISMVGYELLLLVQKQFWGLEIYRAYSCEWGIQQITYSPIYFAVVAVIIASVISYSFPCLLLSKLLHPQQKRYFRSHFSSTLTSCLHKLFHNYRISIMQIISLVLVLSITSIALMFFSLRGKEDVTNPQIIENGKFYETNIGVNRKTLHVDCTIEDTYTTFLAGLLDLDINSGYTEEQYQKLIEKNQFSIAYAWAEIYLNCFYPEGEGKSTLSKIDFVEGEKEWYGLENQDIYNLPCSLLVENQMFYALFPDAELSDNSIYLIEKNHAPFSKGDNLNLYSATGIEDVNSLFYHQIIDTCQFTAEISDVASIEDFRENELLYTILSELVKNNDWIIVVPMQTAQKNALPRLNYEQIYLQYSNGTTDTDVKNTIRTIHTPESSMSLKTISDCDQQYWNAMIQELVIVFTIFGLLLSLAMIGYLQTLKLQLIQKRKQLSILMMLGLSKKQTKKILLQELIRVPIIAIPFSGATIWGIRKFLESQSIKAETIYDIVNTQQYQTEEEATALSQQVEQLKHLFLTEYELWKVPVWNVFGILVLCILVVIIINIIQQSKKTLKNLENEEI